MAERKTAVTPLLPHWSYWSLSLSHWYYLSFINIDCAGNYKMTCLMEDKDTVILPIARWLLQNLVPLQS